MRCTCLLLTQSGLSPDPFQVLWGLLVVDVAPEGAAMTRREFITLLGGTVATGRSLRRRSSQLPVVAFVQPWGA